MNSENYNDFYRKSQTEGIESMKVLGWFRIVDAKEESEQCVYRSRFVDLVKPDGNRKSQLCVAACNDQEHGLFTASPTIKRIPFVCCS